MTTHGRHLPLRSSAGLTALVCGALAMGVGSAAAAAAATPPQVGKATAVTGTVTVKAPGVAAHRLAAGERLTLGTKLIVKANSTATLRLVRPASVPAARDLVFVGSPVGVKITISAYREAGAVIVRVTPAPRSSTPPVVTGGS